MNCTFMETKSKKYRYRYSVSASTRIKILVLVSVCKKVVSVHPYREGWLEGVCEYLMPCECVCVCVCVCVSPEPINHRPTHTDALLPDSAETQQTDLHWDRQAEGGQGRN